MSGAPHPWDVSIDGHNYMLDLAEAGAMRHESIPLLRPIYVTADRLGENDINPESNWRFSDVDWTHGAGQRHADAADSDSSRFWRSLGVDVWTKGQLSLLPDVAAVSGAPTAFFSLLSVGGYLYASTGAGIQFTDDLVTWQTIAASAVFGGLASDGTSIYYTNSGAGSHMYSAPIGSTVGAAYNTSWSPTSALAFVAGRLLDVLASDGSIVNIIGTSGADVVTVGSPPVGFTAVPSTAGSTTFASGLAGIYVLARNDGVEQTQVLRIGISDDGTTLTPPVAATPPIPGNGRTIYSYVGFVFLGFSDGLRMCLPNADGSLTVGARIETPEEVLSFTGRGDYVYFSWSNAADAGGGNVYSGLGRIDPTIVTDAGAPAYATDLMATTTNPLLVVCPIAVWQGDDTLLFALGTDLYRESPDLVSSGFLDSGLISYDLPDDKAARYLTVRTDKSSDGDITPSLAVDGDTAFTGLATVPAGTLTQRDVVGGASGGYFEIRETLNRNASDATQGAVLTRHMLEADPVVISGFFYYVPVELAEEVTTHDGQKHRMDVAAERAYLEGLRGGGVVVTYTELATVYQVTVEDTQWLPTHINTKRDGMNATMALKLKTV